MAGPVLLLLSTCEGLSPVVYSRWPTSEGVGQAGGISPVPLCRRYQQAVRVHNTGTQGTQTHTHTYIYIYMHAYIHTNTVHTFIHTYIHAYIHKSSHASYIHDTCIHTYIHACMLTYMCMFHCELIAHTRYASGLATRIRRPQHKEA